MSYPRAYLLHFSVGDLSCQLLRAIGQHHTGPLSPTNFFTHKHPFWELHYIIEGRFCFAAGQTTYDAGPNQLLLVPPGTEHQLKQVSSEATHRLVISVYIQPPPKRTQSPSHHLYTALYPPSPLLLDVPSDSLLAEALEHIRSLTDHNTLDFTMLEAMRAYASLLLVGLSGLLVKAPAPAATPASQTLAPQSFLIDQFFYHPSIMKGGAPVLAEMLRVSPRQLDRILLDLCGMNFRERLNQAKLNYAIDLLANQSLSITQIAHMLNYSGAASFSAFIKSVTGMTPSQLRRTLPTESPSP